MNMNNLDFRGRSRTRYASNDVNPGRPILGAGFTNGHGQHVTSNNRATLPIQYGPRQVGLSNEPRYGGAQQQPMFYPPSTDGPPLAPQLGSLSEALSSIQAFMEYHAPPKKDIIHKRFRELPDALRSDLVKEQSALSALINKLVVHTKDQDFLMSTRAARR